MNKTQAVHISRVFRTLLGCFGNLSPHGKTQVPTCQVRVIFHFLLNFHPLPWMEDTSSSSQRLEKRTPFPFIVIVFQDRGH